MNGTFAVLTFALGLWDMSQNYCETGCLKTRHVQSYNSISAGDVIFQRNTVGKELYIRRDTKLSQGPFQVIWGASISNDADYWIGVGHAWTKSWPNSNMYVQLHAMPGLYFPKNGTRIGGTIEFRSGVELGYVAKNGARIGLSYDHRSNADINSYNPGLETFQLRVSFPTR
jgi:hypothetical protein